MLVRLYERLYIRATLLLLVWVGFLYLPAFAYGFNLSQSYDSALTYNANYLASIAKNLASKESQVQSAALLKPQIGATGAANENYLNSSGESLFYHQPTAGAQFQQVLFDFSKFSGYSKSKFNTQAADLELELAKQQLILDVAQAYFDVLYAKDTLDAIRMSKDFFDKQLNQANHAFSAGSVTIADVNDAKSSYDVAVADEIKADNELINRKNIFRNLTGLDPELIQPVVQHIELVSPEPQSPDKWSTIAKTNNLNVKLAQLQMQMAREDVSIATSGHLPTLNLNATYQYQGDIGVDGASPAIQQLINQSAGAPGTFLSSFSLGTAAVQVNVPVYSGGAVNSQVRQAKNTYIATQQQLTATERQSDQKIRNAFWQVQNGVNIVNAQTQALKSAALKLKSDQTGYQVGIRNSIDLVGSQRNYYQAIQNYNQARYQYLNARLQLEFLAGKIDSKFLKNINANIQP